MQMCQFCQPAQNKIETMFIVEQAREMQGNNGNIIINLTNNEEDDSKELSVKQHLDWMAQTICIQQVNIANAFIDLTDKTEDKNIDNLTVHTAKTED